MSFLSSLLTYTLYVIAFWCFVGLIIKSKILERFQWYRNYQRNFSLVGTLLPQLMKMIQQSQNRGASRSGPINFILDKSKNRSQTHITYDGRKYSITQPHNRTRAMQMKSIRIELIEKDGSNVDITGPPGMPYLYSAKELGGKGYNIYYQEEMVCQINNPTEKIDIPTVLNIIKDKYYS